MMAYISLSLLLKVQADNSAQQESDANRLKTEQKMSLKERFCLRKQSVSA